MKNRSRCFLGCIGVWSGVRVLTLRGEFLPSFQAVYRKKVALKYEYPLTGIHGVKPDKTNIYVHIRESIKSYKIRESCDTRYLIFQEIVSRMRYNTESFRKTVESVLGVNEGQNQVTGEPMKQLYLLSKFQTTNLKLCVLGIVYRVIEKDGRDLKPL